MVSQTLVDAVIDPAYEERTNQLHTVSMQTFRGTRIFANSNGHCGTLKAGIGCLLIGLVFFSYGGCFAATSRSDGGTDKKKQQESSATSSDPTDVSSVSPAARTSNTEELDTLRDYYIDYSSIESPDDLFDFLHKTYWARAYRTSKLCLDFEQTIFKTDNLQLYCLYKWNYIIYRLKAIAPKPFPDDQNRLTQEYKAGNETVKIDFEKDEHDSWRIAASTVDQTNAIFKTVLGLAPVRYSYLSWLFPSWTYKTIVLDLSLAQWGMIGIEFILGLLLFALIFSVGVILTASYYWIPVRDLSRTAKVLWVEFAAIVMILAWYKMFSLTVLDPKLYSIAYHASTVLCIILGLLMVMRLIDLCADMLREKFRATNSRVDDIVVPLFSRSMKAIALCIGAVSIAEAFDWPVVGLISGMGIGGVALAFAAKETVANLFGSVTVLMDRPFGIGDWIVTNGIEGIVESVGTRSTRIRTFHNSVVSIPNNNLTTAIIDNMGKRNYRRFRTKFNLRYDTSPERIDAFCEGIREIVRRSPSTRKDYISVHLHELSNFSIEIIMMIFFICDDLESENRERAKVLRSILKLAVELDVRFAYPTQTLQVHNQETIACRELSHLDPEESGRIAADKVCSSTDPDLPESP